MKYDCFEQLPVWQSGIDLAHRIYKLTESAAFRMRGDLCDQLRRAALSVSNNIAEGFERGTTEELLTFLYIARGSAGEVRSMLNFCERYFGGRPESDSALHARRPNLKSRISDLKSQTSDTLRQAAPSRTQAKASPRSAIAMANVESAIPDLRSEISNLGSLVESCSRQLRAWADNLQNTDIKGQRRLNSRSQLTYDAECRAESLMKKVDQAVFSRYSAMMPYGGIRESPRLTIMAGECVSDPRRTATMSSGRS